MAVGCGAKCAKFILIVFNIIFWLSGAAILGVGIWLRVDKSAVKVFDLAETAQDDNMFEIACYVLIGIGAFVFLVGFLGCCGALKESKCMLGLYIFFLVIVFAVELAAGILAAVYKDRIMDELDSKLTDTLKKTDFYGEAEGENKYVPTAWGATVNYIQGQFKCCGISSYQEYNNSVFSNSTTNPDSIPFPFTCCKLTNNDFENAEETDVEDWLKCREMDEKYMYKTGCYESVEEWINDHSIILIGVGIGIACLEIFGLIFAICLCRNTGED